jgi:glycosyltransferase involved in cell wall biosynthesis/GT2 family glycosyltransferase
LAFLASLRRLVRRRPLDWNRGAGRAAAERPHAVDVIIPIYGAAAQLRACLASVAAETDLARHGVILVVDGPQDAAVEAVIGDFAMMRILRNDVRLGFVGSVNRGMSASTRDVILLNSDTVVTRGWAEKLIDAAYSSGDVGTVTPLSNHATLCSVPRAFEENLLPAGFDAASFGELVERSSARTYPRLPTGVGVCFYIRRALLDDIGSFDAAHFGLGYGEENDFCMRALARGWLHVADDATFIFHAGHASFGQSRAALQRRAGKLLSRRHPRYMATIAEFMRVDPLAAVRERITAELTGKREAGRLRGGPTFNLTSNPTSNNVGQPLRLSAPTSDVGQPLRLSGPTSRVVHLVHGWPPFQQAGTELYAYWLVRQQRQAHDVAVYVRGADPARADGEAVELSDGGVRVRIVTNHFRVRNPLRRNAIADRSLERDFERFLRAERPGLLHVHHLAGHAFSLVNVARRLGIPIVLQIQDWWFLCARVNLFHRDGNRCSGPAVGKCASCATLTRIPPAPMTNRLLHAMRRAAARSAIAACDAFVVGSNAIRDDYVRAGVLPSSKAVHVIPYGIDIAAPREVRQPARRPIRFGYVGSISAHKGVHTAVEAMRGLDPGQATLRIWGDDAAFPEYADSMKRLMGGAAVTFEGRFREDEKPRVFASMDVLLVPSIGLESFGLAAREAMTCGVPVIATSGGALSEMFPPGLCGEFFPPGDAAALHAILRRMIDEPALIDRWSANIEPPKRNDVHAAEIERVYESVRAARR